MTRRNCEYLDHNIDDHDKDDVVIDHDYLGHDSGGGVALAAVVTTKIMATTRRRPCSPGGPPLCTQ